MSSIAPKADYYKSILRALKKKDYEAGRKLLAKLRKIPFGSRKHFLPWQKAYITRYLRQATHHRYQHFQTTSPKIIRRAKKAGLVTTSKGYWIDKPKWAPRHRIMPDGTIIFYGDKRRVISFAFSKNERIALATADSKSAAKKVLYDTIEARPHIVTAINRGRRVFAGMRFDGGQRAGDLMTIDELFEYIAKNPSIREGLDGLEIVIFR